MPRTVLVHSKCSVKISYYFYVCVEFEQLFICLSRSLDCKFNASYWVEDDLMEL